MRVQEEKNLRFPQTIVRFCRRLVLPGLLVVAILAPALLLLVAVQENRTALIQFRDVNRSGSLRFRSLWVYGAGREGLETRTQIAEMSAICENLRLRYPIAVAATDPPWSAFAGEEARTGHVSWQSANAMREAANRLTMAIEAQAHRGDVRATLLMQVGLLGMAIEFTAVLLLMRRLRYSEEHQRRLATILDSTTDLIGISDPQGRIAYLNNAFRRFLGLGLLDDLSQITIPIHHTPASYALLKTQGIPASQRDGSWQGETLFLAADGQEIPMSQLLLVHTDENGTIQQTSTIARDITAQKQIEDALRVEQSRFAAIAAAQSEIMESALESDALMDLIAQKAAALTGASGAAVSLIEGEDLICRAAAGASEKSLGLCVQIDGSLAGASVKTGEMQLCTDAQNDPRADTETCRLMAVSSLLILPLRHEGAVIGVLSLLSSERNAFNERDGQTLELIVGFVGVALGRSREFEARRVLLEERTASLATLQESQSLFLSSIDAMQEGFAVQDWDSVVLMCNASAERMLGLTSSEYVGQVVTRYGWKFFREDGTDFPRDEHPTRVALRTGKAQPETVFGILRPDQPMQWFLLRAAPLFHIGEERPYAAVQTFSDITARKAAEDELRMAETRLRTVVENAPLILTSLDAKGVYMASEGRGLATLGLSAGQFVGQSVFEVVAGREDILCPIRRALTGEFATYVSEFEGTRWDNECVPLLDGQSHLEGVVIVSHDITARQNAEDTLRRSEDRMRRLHDLTTARSLSSEQKMDALLALGCEVFDLEIGVVTRIVRERYTILHARSPENAVPAGLACATKDTFCSEVVGADQPMAFANIGESSWRDLPAYAIFGLEAYLGAPLWVGDQLYGTLCFSSLSPHTQPFSDADLELLRLMAQWAGSELAREEARQQIESYNIVLGFQKQELEKANAELEALATTDGLTEIKNHRAFQERLEEETVRAQRYGTPLSLILLDVDHFKQYNDSFGHPAGDVVLQSVAHLLQANARETDLAARYGGEEFVVLLPQTDTSGALVIAERIREAIEQSDWPHRDVTVSLGIAALTPGMNGGGDLTAAADRALYQSKAAGRNCVTTYGSLCSPQAVERAAV